MDDRKSGIKKGMVVLGIVAAYFLQSEIRFLPSALMGELAIDFGVPLTTVGNLLSFCMVAAAVSMLGVSVVVEKVGSVNLLVISIFAVAAAGILSYFSVYFSLTLMAYLFCGASQGILECIGVILVSQLFTEKYRAFFCSGLCAVAQITSSMAYSIPVFLDDYIGGWRNLELLWAALAIGTGVCVFVFGRKAIPPTEKKDKKEKPGLIQAIQIKFVLISVISMIVFIWVNNHYSIYLPTYLNEVKSFTREQAGLATSLMYISGFAGAGTAGIFSVKFRKTIYKCAPILMLIGSLMLCMLNFKGGILAGAVLFGFAYQMWIPMAMASFMNLDGITTSALAGATALFNGAGHFLTGLIPTVFTLKMSFMSMQTAYLTTSCLLIFSVALVRVGSRIKEFR